MPIMRMPGVHMPGMNPPEPRLPQPSLAPHMKLKGALPEKKEYGGLSERAMTPKKVALGYIRQVVRSAMSGHVAPQSMSLLQPRKPEVHANPPRGPEFGRFGAPKFRLPM